MMGPRTTEPNVGDRHSTGQCRRECRNARKKPRFGAKKTGNTVSFWSERRESNPHYLLGKQEFCH